MYTLAALLDQGIAPLPLLHGGGRLPNKQMPEDHVRPGGLVKREAAMDSLSLDCGSFSFLDSFLVLLIMTLTTDLTLVLTLFLDIAPDYTSVSF